MCDPGAPDSAPASCLPDRSHGGPPPATAASMHRVAQLEQQVLHLQQRLSQAEAAERMLDALMEYIPEGIAIADAPDVSIARVSRFGQQMTGRDRQALEGISAEEHATRWAFYEKDGVTPARSEDLPLTRAARHGEVVTDEEWVLERPSGEKVTILCNAGPIRDEEGRITGGASAWRDVTERRRLEQRLHVLASARCLLWCADIEETGSEHPCWSVHFASEEAAHRFMPIAVAEGQPYADAWYAARLPEDRVRTSEFGAAEVRAGRDYSQEYRFQTTDGAIRWVQEDVAVEVVEEGKRWRAVGVCTDITDRKEAEDGLAWTLKAAGVGWFGVSMLHDIAAVSPEYAGMLGVSPEECTTRTALAARVHPDDLARLEAQREEACALGDAAVTVPHVRVRHGDGTWRWHQITYRLTYRADGTAAWATGIAVDITDRKEAEAEREGHVREIETLNARLQWAMSETHHRVKNNLQVIAAMIEVQADNHEEAVPLSEIRTLSQHVRGLAAIHELLTEQSKAGGSTDTLSVRAALRKMLPTMEAALFGRHIEMELADVRVPSRQATALAIIANELVANSIKHGRGRITLSLTAGEGAAQLTVQDEGRGFPERFDPERDGHTGLELVLMLARWDLDGAVEFANAPEGGARVTVRFGAE